MPNDARQPVTAELLLLYLADELPPGERDALDRRLADDPSLAGELVLLRDTQTRAFGLLAELDESQRLPVGSGVVVRRVSRAIAQWQVNRAVKAVKPVRRISAVPWWSYPSAAVVIMIVSFLAWSLRQNPVGLAADPEAQQSIRLADADAEFDQLADWLEAGFETPAFALSDDASRPRGADDVGGPVGPREDMSW